MPAKASPPIIGTPKSAAGVRDVAIPPHLLPETRRLSSIRVAAQLYEVHPDTIRRRIAAGQLTAHRFGPRLIRIDLNELEALLRPIPTAGRGDVA